MCVRACVWSCVRMREHACVSVYERVIAKKQEYFRRISHIWDEQYYYLFVIQRIY